MKKYETPNVEIAAFEVEDVVTASGCDTHCALVGFAPDSDDSEFG